MRYHSPTKTSTRRRHAKQKVVEKPLDDDIESNNNNPPDLLHHDDSKRIKISNYHTGTKTKIIGKYRNKLLLLTLIAIITFTLLTKSNIRKNISNNKVKVKVTNDDVVYDYYEDDDNKPINLDNEKAVVPAVLNAPDVTATSLGTANGMHRMLSNKKKQKVVLLPLDHEVAGSETIQILVDGIEKSEYLELTSDVNDKDAVWIIHLIFFDCIDEIIPSFQNGTLPLFLDSTNTSSRQMFFLDFFDFGYTKKYAKYCFKNIARLAKSRQGINFFTRQFMVDRNITYDEDSGGGYGYYGETNAHTESKTFSNMGKPYNFDHKLSSNGVSLINGVPHLLRYGIRSDMIEYIHKKLDVLELPYGGDAYLDKIINRPRPKDAIHFWTPGDDEWIREGRHRSKVSRSMRQWSEQPENADLVITAENVGERDEEGRTNVMEEYVSAMLEYKIVVVCQRDRWEDHYRLMEALAGGALVFTDPMFPLPVGIEDGKQVVVYDSIGKLKTLLKYYLTHDKERLEIARAGHKEAIMNHRSWHIMERIVFGDPNKLHGI